MKKILYFLLAALSVYSCVEIYEPEIGDYESTLVVDGLFTDGEDTSTVLLSRSFAYDERVPVFVTGANVIIEDDAGNRYELAEQSPGKYQNDPAVFTGKPGTSYRLLITTPDGNQFESSWELLKASPPIKEVFHEYQERAQNDPLLPPFKGVQLFLNAGDPENRTRFYRWEYEETYEYGLTYPPVIKVEFGDPPVRGNDSIFYLSLGEWEGFRCWKTVKSTGIFIASTENLSEDIVEDFPLIYVSNSTSRLYLRYSMLVKQYAISEKYFEYLQIIESTNETTGSLFDPIPNEVFGNVQSSDGRDLPVLGYFGVGGNARTRYFVDRGDLPDGIGAPFGPRCMIDSIVPISYGELFNKLRFSGSVLFDYVYSITGDPVGFQLTRPECSNCAASGATNIRPEFW